MPGRTPERAAKNRHGERPHRERERLPPDCATPTRELPSPTVDPRRCRALSIRLSRPSRQPTSSEPTIRPPKTSRDPADHSRRRNRTDRPWSRRTAGDGSGRDHPHTAHQGALPALGTSGSRKLAADREQRSVGVFLTRVSRSKQVRPARRLCGGPHGSTVRPPSTRAAPIQGAPVHRGPNGRIELAGVGGHRHELDVATSHEERVPVRPRRTPGRDDRDEVATAADADRPSCSLAGPTPRPLSRTRARTIAVGSPVARSGVKRNLTPVSP